jgi:outer membrane lipoprotein-sorting protein
MESCIMRRVALFFALVLCVAPVWAGPKEAVHAAFARFLAAKSFRASVIRAGSGEKISDLAFVAPDRYHVKSAHGPEMTLIGDDAWMNLNGRTMKVPMPVGRMIAQYRNAKTLDQLAGTEVTDLGSDTVGGEPAHAYHYTLSEPAKADVKLWVGDKTGMPLQIESQGRVMGKAATTRILYSDFNDASIHIAAPQG